MNRPAATASRPLRVFTATVMAALSAGAVACGGDDGTGTGSDTPAFIDVDVTELSLTEPGQTHQLDVTVRNSTGDALPDALVTYSIDADGVASVSSEGLVQGLGDGEATLTIQAGTVAKALLVSVAITSVELQAGVPVTGLDGPELGQRYYTFDVPAGDANRVLLVRLKGGTGDADLVMREGARPVPASVDCLSASGPNTLDNLEFCVVASPGEGTWHLLVYGYEAYADVSIEADMVPVTELESGVDLADLQAATHELTFFRLQVPATSNVAFATTGAEGDVDLFASTESVFSITDVENMPCVSAGEGSDESCSVTGALAGTWLVTLLAFEGYEGVTLTTQVTGGG